MRIGRRRAKTTDYIEQGSWDVVSDVSGMIFKSSEMVYGEGLEKGLLMHISEFSDGNLAQLYLKSVPDHRQVDDVRTVPPYDFSAPPTEDDF